MSATQDILGNAVTEVETRSGKFVRVNGNGENHYYRVDAAGDWHKLAWNKLPIAAKNGFVGRSYRPW